MNRKHFLFGTSKDVNRTEYVASKTSDGLEIDSHANTRALGEPWQTLRNFAYLALPASLKTQIVI